ncbi:MAG TPA: hypothetical protein VFN10_09955 [Thermoanaerobaculia bacterium]|nr:hypothetical protein [Thermoanaerobaculia bacterium]
MRTPLIVIAGGLVTSLVLTFVVRGVARLRGIVAQPKADRWHRKPTAMLGGVAIALSMNIVALASGRWRDAWVVFAASGIMFAVGLIDDFLHLRPYQKLVGQAAAAALVIQFGLVLPWTGVLLIDIAITILWLVGITNAVNMLDNMDGLAAGIAAIAALMLALTFLRNGQPDLAVLLGIFCAVLVGFLFYNFNPASIFMGDCGSLFVGFFLASFAMMSSFGGRSRTLVAVIAVPVLVLFIPIFDTTFVTILRKAAGRPASQGGRDHTSHRLVQLGLPERHAVLLLWALAAAAGAVAIATRELALDMSLALIGAFCVVVVLIGLYLAGVRVYSPEEHERGGKQPLVAFLIDIGYKRRFFEVLLDLLLIIFSYYLAYRLHFGPMNGGYDWSRFFETLPLVLGTKIVVFLFAGLYRGLWKYVSFDDTLTFVRAVAGGSIAAILVLLFTSRFAGLSRVVFVLDALILFVLILATRSSFRVIRTMLRRATARDATPGVRTLIYGAGDAGELLLRELRNNRSHGRTAVAFFDDDALKAGKVVHGLPVLTGDLGAACRQQQIDEVVISTIALEGERLRRAADVCASLDIPIRRFTIALAPV